MVRNDLSVFSGVTGETRASVTPENAPQERKEKLNHLIRRHQERIQFQIRMEII